MVTTITKTIKPSGGDYTQPQAAWADIPGIVGQADLVAADTAVVFLMDAGVYDSFDCNKDDSLTTDETRNVTFKRAPDTQGHQGQPGKGVLVRVASGTAPAVILQQDHVVLDGLSLRARQGENGNYGVWCKNSSGNIIRNCVIEADGQYSIQMQSDVTGLAPISVIENTLAIGDGTDTDRYIDLRGSTEATGRVQYRMVNCAGFDSQTFVRVGATGVSGGVCSVEFINNFTGNCPRAYQTSGSATLVISGDGNVGPSTLPFPEDIRAGGQTWDISTDVYEESDGNNALYDPRTFKISSARGNDALDAGVGPDADADVPTTDIVGSRRFGDTTQVGPFATLQHIWSSLVIRKAVKVEGALSCGPGQIGAVIDELTATGTASDSTAVMPAGVEGVWLQQLEPVASNFEAIDVKIVVGSTGDDEHTVITLGGSSVDANSGLGFVKLPITMPKNDGTYPFIKATGLGSSAWKIRVIAVGPGGGDWS